MFRKLTDRLSSAASNVLGTEDPNVQRLVQMGFDAPSARNALEASGGNVDRAAELLLSSGAGASSMITTAATPAATTSSHHSSEEETLRRVVEESYRMEQERQTKNDTAAATTTTTKASRKAVRTAAMSKAALAAEQRANGVVSAKVGLSHTHPDIKLIPKLQDKSKEEQVLRCADRLKSSPQAVDTLYRALTAVQKDPDNPKFRKIDKTTAGYQRSLVNAPGAEDLLKAMNYRVHGTQSLMLDRGMVDPALLYLGVSALEQTKLTDEYKQSKAKIAFAKTIQQVRHSADASEAEAIKRAALMAKCPTEPAEGRGALVQVIMAEETVRRRFDGDDTLQDILHWLGGHGSVIPEKIMSREWSLVDLNRYPMAPIDCQANQHHTLQYIGCWPSGRLEVLPSEEEWKERGEVVARAGSSRGLASAPNDVVYNS